MIYLKINYNNISYYHDYYTWKLFVKCVIKLWNRQKFDKISYPLFRLPPLLFLDIYDDIMYIVHTHISTWKHTWNNTVVCKWRNSYSNVSLSFHRFGVQKLTRSGNPTPTRVHHNGWATVGGYIDHIMSVKTSVLHIF